MKITQTKIIFKLVSVLLIQAFLCLDFVFSAGIRQENSLSPMLRIENITFDFGRKYSERAVFQRMGLLTEVNIIDFGDFSANADNCGSKAEMLGRMSKIKDIKVSPGFVLTKDVYELFLRQNGMDGYFTQMQKMVTEYIRAEIQNETAAVDVLKEAILAKANFLRDKFEEGVFPQEVYDELKLKIEKLEKLFPGLTFAVRSSAINAEDMPEFSFAGQLESFPNQKGFENVLMSVRKTFGSLFSDKAVFYRIREQIRLVRKAKIRPQADEIERYLREDPLAPLNIRMAVVIQKMVENVAASGVVFSINPENGERLVRIESTAGLGSNVEGLVIPDYWLINPDNWEIIIKQKGEKTRKFVPGKNGLRVRNTNREERQSFSLTDAEAVDIAKKICLLKRLVKEPHDYGECESEFAVTAGREIYFNQLRKETYWENNFREHRVLIVDPDKAKNAKKIVSGAGMRGHISAFSGRVRVVENLEKFLRSNNEESGGNEIIVAPQTNNSWNTLLLGAVGIISEMGGLTSHAAIVSREWGKPALIGIPGIVEILKRYEGKWVTVDVANLIIYEGRFPLKEAVVDMDKLSEEAADTAQLSAEKLGEQRLDLAYKGGYLDKQKIWMKSPRHPLGNLAMGIFRAGYAMLSKRYNLPVKTKIGKDSESDRQYDEDLLWVSWKDRDALIEFFDDLSFGQVKQIFFDKLSATQEFVEACNQFNADSEGVEGWINAYKKYMSYRHMQFGFTYSLEQRLKKEKISQRYLSAMAGYLRENGLPEDIDACYRQYKPFPTETEKYKNAMERICELCKQKEDADVRDLFVSGKSDAEVLNALRQKNKHEFINVIRTTSLSLKVFDSTDPRISVEDIMVRFIGEVRRNLKLQRNTVLPVAKIDTAILNDLNEGQKELLLYVVLDSIEKDNALPIMVRNQNVYVNKLYELGDRLVENGYLQSRGAILELSEEELLYFVRCLEQKQLKPERLDVSCFFETSI